jgi:hypothetical protein
MLQKVFIALKPCIDGFGMGADPILPWIVLT